jgi:hypothetical protein
VTVVAATEVFYVGFAELWDLAGRRALADGSRALMRLDAHDVPGQNLCAQTQLIGQAGHRVGRRACDIIGHEAQPRQCAQLHRHKLTFAARG